MPTVPQLAGEPYAAADLIAAVQRAHSESVGYWNDYSLHAFFEPMGSHWSAADHVRHLTKSVRAATMAFRLPRWALRIRFGAPRQASRSFAALREDYLAALAAGGAAGRYEPSPLDEASRTTPGRERVMQHHAAAVGEFVHALSRWADGALDHARVPHPLIGHLTLRELAQFTCYHNVHHAQVAERRRLEAGLPMR